MVYLIDHSFVNLIVISFIDLMTFGNKISDSYIERIPIVVILVDNPAVCIKWS